MEGLLGALALMAFAAAFLGAIYGMGMIVILIICYPIFSIPILVIIGVIAFIGRKNAKVDNS